jgi:hypothetical protein
VEALHLPLVYINVHNAYEKTRKLPHRYLVAVAKTLTLRELLQGTPADAHIHWAEKQLPQSERVFIIPHNAADAKDCPPHVQQLVTDAIPKATREYTPMLWRILLTMERFAATFPRSVPLPTIDQQKREVYPKVLQWGDLQSAEDRARLQAVLEEIDKKEKDKLEKARRDWFDRFD